MATTSPLPAELTAYRSPPRVEECGDEVLARLVAEASEPAFAALYERHHQTLYRYCRSILRDESDAQDALQSAWTRALVALRGGQRDAPVRPWLYRIAHNESVSLLRRRQLRAVPADAEGHLDHVASAEERVIERERFALLIDDLQALHPRQRGALLMRELSGLSHEEIAAALETSVAAAKQCVYEARRDLAEFAAGRATPCDDICRRISDGDRRALRGRRMLAHLRHCPSCAHFASMIDARTAALHQLAPWLPAVAASAVLEGALRGGAGAATGSGAVAATGSGAVAATGSGAVAATGGGVSGSVATAGAGGTAAVTAPVAVVTKTIGVSVLGKSLLATAAVTAGVASMVSVGGSHRAAARPAAPGAAARHITARAAVPVRAGGHGRRAAAPAPSGSAAHPAASPAHGTGRRVAAGRSSRVPPGHARQASAAVPPGQARTLTASSPPGQHKSASHAAPGQARNAPVARAPGQAGRLAASPPPRQARHATHVPQPRRAEKAVSAVNPATGWWPPRPALPAPRSTRAPSSP